ncbi:MAG: Type secretion system protein subtype b [Candidatus Sumerlaeota bacterium]|nr:Type secretion system protein subtype b [Candidatus Sumerlaeota bacterium]
MRADKRRRLLLILAACGLGVLLLDAVVVRPLLAIWDKQAARIVQRTQDIERGTALLEREEDIAARWKEMRESSLPADTARAEALVLDAMTKWASASGLSISSVRPRWVEMKDVGDRFEIRLSAEGDIAALTRFLFELETAKLPLYLDETQIRARDENGRSLGVDLVFSALRIEGANT